MIRRALHRFIPAGFENPSALAIRILRSGNPHAVFALRAAALGSLLWPLDVALAPFERARTRAASPPRRPIVLICGSARSGTTVAAQLLLHSFRASYFPNVTSVFTNAPLTAIALFDGSLPSGGAAFQSYYGRTNGWSAPNDALYVWDRWLGKDRGRVPREIAPSVRREMASFFGALERQSGLPAIAKNNALNACAHLVAEALPTARFVCLERARVPLAESLYRARLEIHGRDTRPYGLAPPDRVAEADPVEDVCRQVLFHEQLAREQVARLGPERFRVVGYEDICRDPREFVTQIGREVLGEAPDLSAIDRFWRPFESKRPRDPGLTRRIEDAFARLARFSSRR